MSITRRRRFTVALATAAIAVGGGVAATPAAAGHTCEHSINQRINDSQFGNKAALVQAINDRFDTDFTVGDLNAFIKRVCEDR